MDKPLISIITVTFEDLQGLLRTYESIKPFLNKNIEWIIKDGGSDGKIIKNIKKYLIKDKIKFISNIDKGTYNAMNIALNYASGNWLIFMNGGDSFSSEYFFLDFERFLKFKKLKSSEKIIIVGNYNLVLDSGEKIFVKYRKLEKCKGMNSYRMPTSHQSQIFSRAIFSSLRFRENLKISADHAYFWDAINLNSRVEYFDFIIANFKTGGVSYTKNFQSLKDIIYSLKKIQKINYLTFFLAILKRFIAFYFKFFISINLIRRIRNLKNFLDLQ
tara:strand:- start:170 stop:988 length:819 start_codon:yes stop_codon:yes gene_type:complete